MSRTASPSFTSRTTPMKLAIAPMAGLRLRMAAISAPASKSSGWIRTVIAMPWRRRASAAGDRRKECHFVAVADQRLRAGHLLVDRRAYRFRLAEFPSPRSAAARQRLLQRRNVDPAHGKLELFTAGSKRFAKSREVKNCDHASIMQLLETYMNEDEFSNRLRRVQIELR